MSQIKNMRSWVNRKIRSEMQPAISIIVIIFNMERELKRTLYSLNSKYQEDVSEQDYEVVVIDNGSTIPLTVNYIESFGHNFKYYYIKNPSPSPASAINFGISKTTGKIVGIMIDGARILSPGVIKYALRSMHSYKNPIVTTLSWHIGPDIQSRSIKNGYNQKFEDQLLKSIDWPKNGYRLFEISSLAGSCKYGWFVTVPESNGLFMLRKTFDELGGYDEKFDSPGGGLVNLDMFFRACELNDTNLVVILGEGTFHQIHGGVSTNTSEERNQMLFKEWEEQYFKIRNKRYSFPYKHPEYIGHVPTQALKWILFSAEKAIERLDNAN